MLQVREHPLYHLIKARILRKQGEVQEAAKTLQIAMQLPGVKNSGQCGSAFCTSTRQHGRTFCTSTHQPSAR